MVHHTRWLKQGMVSSRLPWVPSESLSQKRKKKSKSFITRTCFIKYLKKHLNKHFKVICRCVWLHESICTWVQVPQRAEASDPLELGLQTAISFLVGFLRTKLGFSLNRHGFSYFRTIFPVPIVRVLNDWREQYKSIWWTTIANETDCTLNHSRTNTIFVHRDMRFSSSAIKIFEEYISGI